MKKIKIKKKTLIEEHHCDLKNYLIIWVEWTITSLAKLIKKKFIFRTYPEINT